MKVGQLSKALSHYNEAVICAETNSQNLSMALANRAFLWMKLEEFEKAQVDLLWIIQMGNYSKEAFYKIYQRLGIVLQKLQKTRFQTLYLCANYLLTRSKSILELWVTTFLPD